MADDPMFQRFGREFPRGAVLFREGEPGKEMFVVHQGRVAITKKVADVEKILSTLGPGEFLGARQAVQFAVVRAGGRLELETGALPRGWSRVDWSAVPAFLQNRTDRSVPALAQILDSDQLSPSRKAQALEDFTLPLAWAFEMLQWRARLPPRKRKHHKRQRIVLDRWRPQSRHEFLFVFSAVYGRLHVVPMVLLLGRLLHLTLPTLSFAPRPARQ